MPFVAPVAQRPAYVPAQYASAAATALPAQNTAAQGPDKAAAQSEAAKTDDSSFSFRDFLSVINPLQHIPIVGSIYRAITGDTISTPAKIIGDALFGGPIGLLTSVADSIVEQVTGKDVGGHALALFTPDKQELPAGPEYASAGAEPAARAVTPATPWGVAAASPAAVPVAASLTSDAAPAIDASSTPEAQRDAAVVATASRPQQGRTLVQYQTYAGQRLPVLDTTRGANSGARASAPVPLETTLPLMADRLRTPVLPKGGDERASAPAAQPASSPAAAVSEPVSADDWVSSVMMKNLDRYREMKQRQTQQAPTIDQAI